MGDYSAPAMVLNEFVALAAARPHEGQRSTRDSFTIASFALAGFANFSSVGIQIGGIGALAPDRKSDLAKLGALRDAGRHARQLLSATIAGILL